ncbi:hypothetical protein SAMN05444722_0185 [Rhodovulum sp. ES.010]|uniref:hypothetical protein n=1 Tax=Rhodovulum sp. ES.010 TaxID=1882821 RepID=UPI0009261EAC|nr:hypothetical protein [Rhodovulum sp. ES.010]SIO03463.1 hypothetical protein SAMN05444722_0185 [Rhodovulum sp. ES.010]
MAGQTGWGKRGRAVALMAAVALSGPAPAAPLPKGEGLATVRRECTRCHSLRNIRDSDGFTREEWRDFVLQMTDLERRPADLEAVVDYLAEHFPPFE